MAVLLAGLLILALRHRRRRERRRWLDGTLLEIHMSDHGDHLRLACALHLEPFEGIHLRRWRVALVCAGTEHFPWLDDLAAISEEDLLYERLDRPQEIELACILRCRWIGLNTPAAWPPRPPSPPAGASAWSWTSAPDSSGWASPRRWRISMSCTGW